MYNKNFLRILRFELMVQTKTKSFWLISLIPPIAMILMFIVNYNSGHIDSVIVDNQTAIDLPLESSSTMTVRYGSSLNWQQEGYDASLLIKESNNGSVLCEIYSKNILLPINQIAIKNSLETRMAEKKLGVNFSNAKLLVRNKIKLENHIVNPRYKLIGISMTAIFLIYLIILQFASSILRMTGREKKNKISEILLSAMSPRVIMAGKLVACLLAALLQIIIWCIVGLGLIFLSNKCVLDTNNHAITSLLQMFSQIPTEQLVEFLFIYMLYLVGGFLLYCILFSLLGAISNENTNTQQFSLIVTIPLLMTFVYVVKDLGGDSQWLTWLSYIPLSSPIAAIPIMAKEGLSCNICISLIILYFTTFVAFYYVCALYKDGVLASKSKITLKTLIKWVRK
ncbi:ABC transporter permease [Prevotella sp. SGI.027]